MQGAVRSPKSRGGDLNNPWNQPKPKPSPKHHTWDQHKVNLAIFTFHGIDQNKISIS